ncbi:MAG: fused response regulator/phosphatase [Magnetococcus sp. YQC-5]
MSTTESKKLPTVLIVDDEPLNVQVLAALLQKDYHIRFTTRGEKAVKLAISQNPDIILLDVVMPDMDGYAICKLLKENETTRNIPIIFVTALKEEEYEGIGLALGAVDYIIKPVNQTIVLARLKTHLALREAAQIIEEQNLLLKDERELIESIILKMRSADHIDERHLRYLISPVENTSGDMLLSSFTPDGRQIILLGDFTGHGLPAAVGGPLVASVFQILVDQGTAGKNILREINNQLNIRLPVGIFFAASIIELDAPRQNAVLLNAGMLDCLCFKKNGQILHFHSQLLPLGIHYIFDLNISERHLQLDPGDKFYIFTDGIIEALSPDAEPFGMARLQKFLANHAVHGDPLDGILNQLQLFCKTSCNKDDITLVEIQT